MFSRLKRTIEITNFIVFLFIWIVVCFIYADYLLDSTIISPNKFKIFILSSVLILIFSVSNLDWSN